MDVMRNSLETYFVLLSIISSPWSNIKHYDGSETLCPRESLETHIHTFYHLLSSFYWVMVHLGSTENCHWFYVQFTASVSAGWWVPGTYLWKRIFTGKRFWVPRPRKSPCFTFFPSFVIFNRLKYIVFIKNLIDRQKSMKESPPLSCPLGQRSAPQGWDQSKAGSALFSPFCSWFSSCSSLCPDSAPS